MKLLSFVTLRLAWLISVVLTVLDGIALRMVAVELAVLITNSVPIEQQAERGWFLYRILPAVDKFAVAILGVAALVLVLSFEYIYRAALAKGMLRKRFSIITAVQVGVLVGCGIVILML